MSGRRWLSLVLLLAALAGCGSQALTPTPGVPHGCDRNGDEDQRRAC